MRAAEKKNRIALIGGGPSALCCYKRLIEAPLQGLHISIFEKTNRLGAGMPYSEAGANIEHITNVSGNEIPEFVTPLSEWIKRIPKEKADIFSIDPSNFSDYRVLPRLLFGDYLEEQFDLLIKKATKKGHTTQVHLATFVSDITDDAAAEQTTVTTNKGTETFDWVVICTGHTWPKAQEGKLPRYFDSPYPPSKLRLDCNHTVALKGASLTAIDAMRTLSRHNGHFLPDGKGQLRFQAKATAPKFKIAMHSRHGLLPALRFHLADAHLKYNSLLTQEDIAMHREKNNGFLSLDFIFEEDFKKQLASRDPDFYHKIKDMAMEAFVDALMEFRESVAPFALLKAEYAEAETSIARREPVYWKEMLAALSFAMNYPAKYFSAEDMLRLQHTLKPLISIVIAFVPQRSCMEMMALHQAGRLDIVGVGSDSQLLPCPDGGVFWTYEEDGNAVSERFETYVDCTGQPPMDFADFPFAGLSKNGTVTQATLAFRSVEAARAEQERNPGKVVANPDGSFLLKVPGLAINDRFQVTDRFGAYNPRIYIMAVPYIGGFNPDYSGLDFGEEASAKVLEGILDGGAR